MTEQQTRPLDVAAVGGRLDRVDGLEKVTGRAAYAVDHGDLPGGPPLYAWIVPSTIAKGRVTGVDATRALAEPGVVSVLDHTSAARLDDTSDRELAVLQDDRVGFRG
jgi:xanthine dehydrogenase YagR molybdenum-binding subunit